jgi:hypothetical protein
MKKTKQLIFQSSAMLTHIPMYLSFTHTREHWVSIDAKNETFCSGRAQFSSKLGTLRSVVSQQQHLFAAWSFLFFFQRRTQLFDYSPAGFINKSKRLIGLTQISATK